MRYVWRHKWTHQAMGYPRASLWSKEGNKPIWGNIQAKKYIFSKKYFMSFLPHYCHSFRITVIPSVLLSFLPYYCHSFRIIVIPSVLVSFLPNIVIPSELFRELHILTSSKRFPYLKGEKNGHQRWPYMRVYSKIWLWNWQIFLVRYGMF